MTPAAPFLRRGVLMPLLAFALLAAAAISLLTTGSGTQSGSVSDAFFWLNGGWRMLHGQAPYRDFSVPVGGFACVIAWAGMLVKGPVTGALAAGKAILGLGCAVTAYAVLRRRTDQTLTLAGTLLAGFLVMAVREPGGPFDVRNDSFFYNRIAEALTALCVWMAWLQPNRPSRYVEWAEGFLVGILIHVMVHCKISYAGMASVLVLFGAIIARRLPWSWLLSVALGFATSVLAFVVLAGIPAEIMLKDLLLPFQTGTILHNIPRVFAGGVKGLPYGVMLFLIVWLRWKAGASRREMLSCLSASVLAFVFSVLSAMASYQIQEYILPAAMSLCLARTFKAGEKGALPARLLAAATILATLIPDALSVGAGRASLQAAPSMEVRIASEAFVDYHLDPGMTRMADMYNDTLAVIREYKPAGTAVMTMDWSDPFSFALGEKPPEGGSLFFVPGFFNQTFHPDVERIFAGRPWILLTKDQRIREAIIGTYGAYLSENYVPVATTAYYELLRPN